MNRLVTVIEMTRSGVRLTVGYYLQATTKPYVLEALEGEPLPLDGNGLLEKKAVKESLMLLLNEAKRALKMNSLGNFILLLPPDGFKVFSGSHTTYTTQDRICQGDYNNLANMLMKTHSEPGETSLFVSPVTFTTADNATSEEFPLNAHSSSLSMVGDVQFVSSFTLDYYTQILKESGISAPYLTLVSTFATSHYLFSFGTIKTGFHLEFAKNYTYLSYVSRQRLIYSKSFDIGLENVIASASNELGISEERMNELARLFGLRKEAGFMYTTDEKLKLNDIARALENGLKPLLEQIYDEIEDNNNQGADPIVLTGCGTELDNLSEFLQSYFGSRRLVYTYQSQTFGARNHSFVPCVGAIQLTKEKYLPPLQDTGRHETADELSNNRFSRG